MISQKDLISLLNEFYTGTEPVADTVVRCSRTYKGEPYQYFFFDHSDDFLSFDLGLYLKRFLSELYFKSEGALQWNFYVVFLTSKTIAESDRRRIENNVDYARKMIVSETELSQWLHRTYLSGNGQAPVAHEGLADIWKGLLREQQLDCIFSPQVKLNEGVEKIVSGKYFIEKEAKDSNRQFQDKDTKLGALTYFNPIKYRDYPKFEQPFNFKKVNLIDGANGFGKTSLLEGIEFFITGENNRLDDTSENYQLEAQFADDLHPRKYKKDSPLFRERDRVWYNGMDRLRGSDLSAHFNRFNFFNTDAAFRLTLNKSDDEIENAFRDIALGDQVNFLKRQMSVYETRLQSELKSRKSLLAEYDSDLKTARGLLSELRKSQVDTSRLLPQLYENLRRLEINADLSKQDLPALDRLKFSLSVLATELDNVATDITWIQEVSLLSLRQEEEALKKINTLAGQYREAEAAALKITNELALTEQWNEAVILLIAELTPYYEGGVYQNILGLAEKLGRQRSKVELVHNLNESFTGIRAFDFTSPGRLFGNSMEILADNIQEERKREGDITEQIKRYERSLSAVNALIANIKAQGRNYIELAKGSNTCPLCQTRFDAPADLRSAILRTLEDTVTNKDFNALLDIRSSIVDRIKESAKQLESLQLLKGLFQRSGITANIDEQTVSAVLQQLNALTETLQAEELRLSEMEQQQLEFRQNKLDETRLEELVAKFVLLFPNELLNVANFKALSDKTKAVIQKNSDTTEQEKARIERLSAQLLKAVQEYDPKLALSSLDSLKQREFYAGHYLYELENLVDDDFDEEVLLASLQLKVQRIMGHLDEIRADMVAQQQESGVSAKANATISLKTEQKAAVTAEKERIEAALETIDLISKKHSENDFLVEFLNTNKQEIKNTFLAIHSPREFVDIDISDGKIRLFKMDQKPTDLYHISTGQRSAMALSLFLTLNKKSQNGPPMIIFDDPVAFTDDLNILSFLDYLREIVLSQVHEKQLFFATANENLSFLFQKKFEVFADDFNHITLKR